MPKFSVSKSTRVEVPAEKIFGIVRDLATWPTWSPWVVAEPDCKLEFAPDGKSYAWDGKIIGSGQIGVVGETVPREIVLRLQFLKPWKSEADVRFTFVEKGASTEVTWGLVGSLPIFMFFLKTMMTVLIGMDYERGLLMLKDYCETGSVPSTLAFPGAARVPAFAYIGIAAECPRETLGERMEADFAKLDQFMAGRGIEAVGNSFSRYTKWKLVKGIAGYTCGYPVAKVPADLPAEFVSGEHPACSTYPVVHTGPFRHLGNAWAAGIMHGRAKQFFQSRKVVPFEIYENYEKGTDENAFRTVVHFPVK